MGCVGFLFFAPCCCWDTWQVVCLNLFHVSEPCTSVVETHKKLHRRGNSTCSMPSWCNFVLHPRGVDALSLSLIILLSGGTICCDVNCSIPLAEGLVFKLYLGAAPYNSSCHFLSPLQDEQSAVSMLKKHQILEQAVEDYAETVHQLSKTSRTLVADNHPERY